MVHWWGRVIQPYLTVRVWIPVRRAGPFNGLGSISLKIGLTAHKHIIERIGESWCRWRESNPHAYC
jgi:hypothetical protein